VSEWAGKTRPVLILGGIVPVVLNLMNNFFEKFSALTTQKQFD